MTKLTVGMATVEDFHGVYFTIQTARMALSPAEREQVEFLVVDNAPDTALGKEIRGFCGKVGATYIALPSPRGTAAPRQRVFDAARGRAVVCVDSHVILPPGVLSRLLSFFDALPDDDRNLYQGPMLHDGLREQGDLFIPRWRAHMFGIWGRAWQHRDGRTVWLDGLPDMRRCASYLAGDYAAPWTVSDDYASAMRHLQDSGFSPLRPDHRPFDIPAQGLGLFGCLRRAWMGFNPHFREFGGEEGYIHEKFRRGGGRCILLPWLEWGHRFGPSTGKPYPGSLYGTVRNYVLGALELGQPLEPIYSHFVDLGFDGPSLEAHLAYEHSLGAQEIQAAGSPQAAHQRKKLPPADWEWLIADPTSRERPPARSKPQAAVGLGGLIDTILGQPRDLNSHTDTLAALAGQCGVVWEFTRRTQSTAALLRSGAAVYSLADTRDDERKALEALAGDRLRPLEAGKLPAEGCDMAFVKPLHNHPPDKLLSLLEQVAQHTRRWIVVHDTILDRWPETGDPGPVWALRDFVRGNPGWFVAQHAEAQFGLTVLSRDPVDRPAQPVEPWPKGGPGSELSAVLHALGINPAGNCGCRSHMRQMDSWGAAGCRERRAEIIGWLRDGAPKYGWADRLKAAANAVRTGLALKINWVDPYPDLVDLAIAQAEVKEAAA